MEWLVIAICLNLNALLAATEMAFVTLTRPQVKELVKSGQPAAKLLLELRESPERTLSVIQIGISLVGALAAAVGGAEAHNTLTPYLMSVLPIGQQTATVISIAAIVIPLTFLQVVLGELVPKTLALRAPLKIALFSARWLIILEKIFLPIVDLLEWSTKRILKILFPKSKPQLVGPNDDTVELDMLSSQARQYILNLVGLEKKRVGDISLPWSQVDHVYLKQPIEEVEAVALRSGHTRLPVMADEEIFGIINTKELLALIKSGGSKWTAIVRPMSKVQEHETLFKSLRQMQEKRSHLSAVYSGPTLTGIVTMEDILEEVIGEVYDEDDDGALKRILGGIGRIRGPNQTGR